MGHVAATTGCWRGAPSLTSAFATCWLPGTEGGVTRHLPDGEVTSIFDAAMKYKAEGVPLVILAGSEYGTGSSRDWAAKGPFLLGVRAVIASSFERIHRSNLVGMGILPLQLPAGQSWESLGLTGVEVFDIPELSDSLKPGMELAISATAPDGTVRSLRPRSALIRRSKSNTIETAASCRQSCVTWPAH